MKMKSISRLGRAVLLLTGSAATLACAGSDEVATRLQLRIDANAAIVIRQVYGGGSNSGAPFTHDFIELFNRSAQPVTLSGYSLQYASATGTGNLGANTGQLTELPTITLAPGQSYLVQEAGGSVGVPLTADFVDPTPISMSATGGKVALVSSVSSVGCNGASSPCSAAQLASIVDLIGYGTANFFEGGAAPATSNSTAALRAVEGCQDSNDNAADFAAGTPVPRNSTSPLAACDGGGGGGGGGAGGSSAGGGAGGSSAGSGGSSAGSGGSGGTTPLPALKIHDIQGAAHLSVYPGQAVANVPGVVTALRSNGFYFQDPTPDANPATSEGLFVFTSTAPSVAVGASVLVTGVVSEYRPGCSGCGPSSSAYGNLTTTELEQPSVVVVSTGNPLPDAVLIGTSGRTPPSAVIADDAVAGNVESAGSVFDPENDGVDFYESLEGMRVTLQNARAVGPSADFSGGSREIPVVGDDGAAAGLLTARGGVVIQASDFNPERIHLDNTLVPLPVVNVGDSFPGSIVGVLDYTFANFKLLVSEPLPALAPGGLLKETTTLGARDPNQLTLASFNVENLDPSDPPSKFAALGSELVNNLGAPDLVALEEVQDNSGPTSDGVVDASQTVALLVAAINAAGGPTYSYASVDPENGKDGGEPGGNIRVGFLYRTDRGLKLVSRPGATFSTANSVVNGSGKPSLAYSPGRIDPGNSAFANSRKPLAAQFSFNGVSFFAVANHFNSKGGDQPLFGRFQPPPLGSEAQRLAQAQVVRTFVEQIRAVDANAAIVVLGDLNDFEFSTPVSLLKAAGLHALVETLPANERYSYVYQGNSQVLDQVMVSDGLVSKLAGFDIVHINAEFADQTSDHDPAVALLTLGSPIVQCAAEAFTSSSLAEACSAVDAGTVSVQGAAPTGSAVLAQLSDGQPYGLRLVEVSPGSYVGRFAYSVSGAAERHVFYTGTPGPPLSLSGVASAGVEHLECRRYLSEPVKLGLVGETCGSLKEGLVTEVLPSGEYVLEIGPTPFRWVRFHSGSEARPIVAPQLTSSCGAPSPATCAAGVAPTALSAPGQGSLHPPELAVDTAYGIRLKVERAGGLEGAVVFVPPSSGDYLLSLGTPYFPVQVRAEDAPAPLAPTCAGSVPSAASCGLFKSSQRFQLNAGTRYRVELAGVMDTSWVRLAISPAVAAP